MNEIELISRIMYHGVASVEIERAHTLRRYVNVSGASHRRLVRALDKCGIRESSVIVGKTTTMVLISYRVGG